MSCGGLGGIIVIVYLHVVPVYDAGAIKYLLLAVAF